MDRAALEELLQRDDNDTAPAGLSKTCGWLSGFESTRFVRVHLTMLIFSEYPITCGPGRGCVNVLSLSAHGCSTDMLSDCSVATTCIASADLPVSCPDILCSQNDAIQKW